VENVAVPALVWKDVKGLVRKVVLLEGEVADARQAQEVVEEKFRSLSDESADEARRLVVSEMEHREQFEDFSLL
jgi:hypothetical protein